MRLLRYLRRYGLRDGWFIWREQSRIEGFTALASYAANLRPPLRIHHGEKPRLTGYRRRR